MTKHIFIARSVNTRNSAEAFGVFNTREDATSQALYWKRHLTRMELEHDLTTVEGYTIEVPDDDARSALELFSDITADDETAFLDTNDCTIIEDKEEEEEEDEDKSEE